MPKQTTPTSESRQDNRNIWRVRVDDLVAYIDAAFAKTAQSIASGQIPDGKPPLQPESEFVAETIRCPCDRSEWRRYPTTRDGSKAASKMGSNPAFGGKSYGPW